jgi:hypothetical protein
MTSKISFRFFPADDEVCDDEYLVYIEDTKAERFSVQVERGRIIALNDFDGETMGHYNVSSLDAAASKIEELLS